MGVFFIKNTYYELFKTLYPSGYGNAFHCQL